MKKIIAFFLVLLMLFFVVACTENVNLPTTTTTTTDALTTSTSAVISNQDYSYLNDFIGYWYRNPPTDEQYHMTLDEIFAEGVLIDQEMILPAELHIKTVSDNIVTIDYTIYSQRDNDVIIELDGRSGKFEKTSTNSTSYKMNGELTFNLDNTISVKLMVEKAGNCGMYDFSFSYKSTEAIVHDFQVSSTPNYNLTDYVGVWYNNKLNTSTVGNSYVIIKQVNDNVIVFDYDIWMESNESDLVVEINNNIGIFYNEDTFGMIWFDEKEVKIIADKIYQGSWPARRELKYHYALQP